MIANKEELLSQLENCEDLIKTAPKLPQESTVLLTDENVNDFVIKKTAALVNHGIEVIESVKDVIAGAQDAEELAALSELIKATTSAIDTMNKLNMQNKKLKQTKELKELDMGRQPKEVGAVTNNTLIITGNREDIFRKFIKEAGGDIMDAEFTEKTKKEA